MALDGTAFLALFNDFEPDRDAEYNEWHSREHVPERLTVPGIARARRYVNRADAQFPYFTLYEVTSSRSMLSPPYLDLLANPTPWSARMRPSFRQFLRVPCETLASVSKGIGGAILVVRLVGEGAPRCCSGRSFVRNSRSSAEWSAPMRASTMPHYLGQPA